MNFGPGAPRRRTTATNWRKPTRWNASPFWECGCCAWRGFETDMVKRDDGFGAWIGCPQCGAATMKAARQRVFCASLADWLDNAVPIEWFVDLLELVRSTPHLDWLLLTKRIGNWKRRMLEALQWVINHHSPAELARWISEWLDGESPANVWLGATVVDQHEADRDIPKLLFTPAKVRFLSLEPLISPVDLSRIDLPNGQALLPLAGSGGPNKVVATAYEHPAIDWVIVGGESGPGARPMHPDWVRDVRDQCSEHGVPFMFKQWGEWTPVVQQPGASTGTFQGASFFGGSWSFETVDGASDAEATRPDLIKVGKRNAGRLLDDEAWNMFPRMAPRARTLSTPARKTQNSQTTEIVEDVPQ